MIRTQDKKIIMTEKDFGTALPITIVGVNIDADEIIKFYIKKIDGGEPIITKTFENIENNKFDLIFTKDDSEKLETDTYFYYIDWYKGDVFLSNIINKEIFEVEDK